MMEDKENKYWEETSLCHNLLEPLIHPAVSNPFKTFSDPVLQTVHKALKWEGVAASLLNISSL